MANINKVILIGNLTRDPEVRYTPNGTAVADIGLAINRKFKQGDEVKEETTFVDVTLWARQAEVAGEFLKKGHPAYIEGRLQLETWEDKQTGDKRSKLKVVGENLQLLNKTGGGSGSGSGGDSEQSAPPARNGKSTGKSNSRPAGRATAPAPSSEPETDDIPF